MTDNTSTTAQEIFEKSFQDNNGVVELSTIVNAIKQAGNVDSTVVWRMFHNKNAFYFIGNYLVSKFISPKTADEILAKRFKPAKRARK